MSGDMSIVDRVIMLDRRLSRATSRARIAQLNCEPVHHKEIKALSEEILAGLQHLDVTHPYILSPKQHTRFQLNAEAAQMMYVPEPASPMSQEARDRYARMVCSISGL